MKSVNYYVVAIGSAGLGLLFGLYTSGSAKAGNPQAPAAMLASAAIGQAEGPDCPNAVPVCIKNGSLPINYHEGSGVGCVCVKNMGDMCRPVYDGVRAAHSRIAQSFNAYTLVLGPGQSSQPLTCPGAKGCGTPPYPNTGPAALLLNSLTLQNVGEAGDGQITTTSGIILDCRGENTVHLTFPAGVAVQFGNNDPFVVTNTGPTTIRVTLSTACTEPCECPSPDGLCQICVNYPPPPTVGTRPGK